MRRRLVMLFMAVCIFPPRPVAAETQIFSCDEPKGLRVDWGDLWALDGRRLQAYESGPVWEADGFSGVNPIVVVDEDTMLVTWANAVPPTLKGEVDPGRKVTRVPILGRDNISAWGMTAGGRTVEIWRFYFHYRTLYRITSSVALTLQDPQTTPSMAAIYVADCRPG